jgi:hypothetical protein
MHLERRSQRVFESMLLATTGHVLKGLFSRFTAIIKSKALKFRVQNGVA